MAPLTPCVGFFAGIVDQVRSLLYQDPDPQVVANCLQVSLGVDGDGVMQQHMKVFASRVMLWGVAQRKRREELRRFGEWEV